MNEKNHSPQLTLHESPGPTDRKVGLVVAGFLLLLMVLHDYATLREGFIGLSSAVLLALVLGLFTLAALRPVTLAPVNKVWMGLSRVLHASISPLVLGGVFLLVLTPMAILHRNKSRKSFPMAKDPCAKSYWIPRAPPGPDPKSLYRQF